MNTQSNPMPESPRDSQNKRIAGNRTRGCIGDSALLLVGAARIVGVPFDLYRAAGRRCRLSARLHDQPDLAAAQHA